ncbi:MAG: major capsid protein [Clostridia bacterium]|nr:major capsid protein [Clostridia bacterium]
MPIDIYSTRAQLRSVELMPREYSFLYDLFVHDAGLCEDDKAIFDFFKGGKPMAPFVHKSSGGVLMARDDFDTREISFCTIAPERIVNLNDMNRRMFGEDVLGAMTPAERAQKTQAQDLLDMRAAIQRRREWMVRQLLLTGKQEIFEYTNEGLSKKPNLIADFKFTNNYVPGATWDGTDAKIDYDIRKMFELVYEGLGQVDSIVMAGDVYEAMLSNSKLLEKMDKDKVDIGNMMTNYRGAGVRYLGHNTDGVDMYSMFGTFIDDDGKVKPIIPSGTLIAGSRGMLEIMHGPVTQVEETGMNAKGKTYIKKEVPLRYGSINGNSIKNRLTSRPALRPINIDGFAVAKVL